MAVDFPIPFDKLQPLNNIPRKRKDTNFFSMCSVPIYDRRLWKSSLKLDSRCTFDGYCQVRVLFIAKCLDRFKARRAIGWINAKEQTNRGGEDRSEQNRINAHEWREVITGGNRNASYDEGD